MRGLRPNPPEPEPDDTDPYASTESTEPQADDSADVADGSGDDEWEMKGGGGDEDDGDYDGRLRFDNECGVEDGAEEEFDRCHVPGCEVLIPLDGKGNAALSCPEHERQRGE